MKPALVYTCPCCRALVDYGCLCANPPTIDQLVGHDTVRAAKEHLRRMAPVEKPETGE